MSEGNRVYGPSVALIGAGATIVAGNNAAGWLLIALGVIWVRWARNGDRA